MPRRRSSSTKGAKNASRIIGMTDAVMTARTLVYYREKQNQHR